MATHAGFGDPQNPLIATARQRSYFSAAIAVLSVRLPLSESQRVILRECMTHEGVAPDVADSLLSLAILGCGAETISLNPHFDMERRVDWLAGVTLLALRIGGDPSVSADERLDVARKLAASCNLPPDTVGLLQKNLFAALAAGCIGLRAQLDEYLHPPAAVDLAARTVLRIIDPSRRPKRSVAHITPGRFQHTLDKEWMDKLENTAGFDDLIKTFFKHYHEKQARVLNLSSAIKVGPDQFGELYATFKGCVERLGVHPEPELYVRGGGLNAFTSGVESKYIMLESGTVSVCSRNELEFILGHELGHIIFDHVLYHTLTRVGPWLASQIPVIGGLISGVAGIGLQALLYQWYRAAEFTCDRAGLMACQDLDAGLKLMVKFAGAPLDYYQSINVEAFLRQADEFDNLDSDFLTSLYKMQIGIFQTHPWTVMRCAELKRWHDQGGYQQIMKDCPAPPEIHDPIAVLPVISAAVQCPECRAAVPPGDRFCSNCGTAMNGTSKRA